VCLEASIKPHIHQKFEIFWTNIASTMACPNFKNGSENGLRPLGVKYRSVLCHSLKYKKPFTRKIKRWRDNNFRFVNGKVGGLAYKERLPIFTLKALLKLEDSSFLRYAGNSLTNIKMNMFLQKCKDGSSMWIGSKYIVCYDTHQWNIIIHHFNKYLEIK
jgi:hypothetical protein